MERDHILILAFSQCERDARVLRQARHLGERFRVTLAGFGPDPFHADPPPNVTWFEIETQGRVLKRYKMIQVIAASLCRISPWFLNLYFKQLPYWRHAWHLAQSRQFRVIYCNDPDTLPVGIAAMRASRTAKVILDLHEYSTREMSSGFDWTWKRKPVVTRILKSLAPHAHGVVTVAESFVPLMKKEFGMRRPIVVHNAPDLVPLPPRPARADGSVHLVHHGGAMRIRSLENMIRAVAMAGKRFVLHFMLIGEEEEYKAFLHAEAERLAPGRVFFEPPVKPAEIVPGISRHDIGVFLLPPVNFNYEHAMPNKLFDFVGAGLGVAVGPSPNMAKFTREHGIGWVSDDFTPESFARMLDSITPGQIEACRAASLRLRETCNAKTELAKLVDLVEKVASRKPKQAAQTA